jgi:hypothetical protein
MVGEPWVETFKYRDLGNIKANLKTMKADATKKGSSVINAHSRPGLSRFRVHRRGVTDPSHSPHRRLPTGHLKQKNRPMGGSFDFLPGLVGPNGAGEAIRTPDPNLGKVMLYP